ncbi:tRNA pseudouridine(55) synthase TruB [Xylocopilactobacillus apicola]|uniref:tRNA pseudouridine synthase B n=1 Tax=Xylocopilactobacillus apicola TaxID=2932184 RepID=A0AAU9DMW1_9LACO|nr:tRNA pseudouridine(55) synthase TruB [Xylocopilactobacillus apicola]BDR58347.1 tRNA pseudouridine synthase B [Xylocopilactobacillus apicola]
MINGVIPVYKEAGNSSFFYVNQVKKIFNQKKVGHTGTLDPMVTGVLPICLGAATKLVPFLMEKKKSYACTILLGLATETEDLEGNIVAKKAVDEAISQGELDRVLSSFKGKNYQVPPFFSAVRYHGKHLYEYARENIFIQKPPRELEITQINRTSDIKFNDDRTCEFSFEVVCSKGTYIRTLCTQIGSELGYPAVMKKLVRISSGGFKLDEAVPINQIKEKVYSIEDVLKEFPTVQLSEKQFKLVSNGVRLSLKLDDEFVALKFHERIVAIYKKQNGEFCASTMFLDNINGNN